MEKIKKQDDSVMKALEVKVIRRLICNTDKGPLDLVIRKGENNYFLMLDSTPIEKEINDKLMGILFSKETPQVDNGYRETKLAKPTTATEIAMIINKEPVVLKKKSYYKAKVK